jgi:DNA-directed RNA polymerase specialized sigma24 family protein
VLSYARRQDSGRTSLDDKEALATEIWETVLRSVAKTRARLTDDDSRIDNLEAYLMGAFQHRFNRTLKRERQRQHLVRSVPQHHLASLPGIRALKWKYGFERDLQLQQIVGHMDNWTREVWVSRQYGYSWREIAMTHGTNEAQAKMRFRNAIAKIRQKLSAGVSAKKDERGGS